MVCFSSNTAFGFQGYCRLSEDVMLKSPPSLFPSGFSKLEYFLWIKWSMCDVNERHSNAKQVKCLTIWNAKRAPELKALSSAPRVDRLIYKVNSCEKVIIRAGIWLSLLVPVLGLFKSKLLWSFTIFTVPGTRRQSTYCTVTVHLMNDSHPKKSTDEPRCSVFPKKGKNKNALINQCWPKWTEKRKNWKSCSHMPDLKSKTSPELLQTSASLVQLMDASPSGPSWVSIKTEAEYNKWTEKTHTHTHKQYANVYMLWRNNSFGILETSYKPSTAPIFRAFCVSPFHPPC